MQSEEKTIIARVVNNFFRSGRPADDQVQVVQLPAGKTSFVEQNGDQGRSIMLDEYRVENRVVWAGYSSRSKTVYLSPARA